MSLEELAKEYDKQVEILEKKKQKTEKSLEILKGENKHRAYKKIKIIQSMIDDCMDTRNELKNYYVA